MAWCDKVGILILALLALFGLFLGSTSGHEANVWFPAFLSIYLGTIGLKIVLPIWLFLRLIDFVTGGVARRRGKIRAHIVEPY